MAFNPALLVRMQPSTLFTQPATIPNVQPAKLAPAFWMYNAGSDVIATVEGNGYFYYFADWLNTLEYNNGQFLAVGDLIWAHCSDGDLWISVTQIQPIIETAAATTPPNSISTADIQNQAVTAAKIANGTITTTQISATAGITFTQLAALTSAQLLVGSAGNVATSVALSGDATISNTGVLQVNTVQANAVVTASITNANVTLAKLAAGITPSHIVKFGAQYTTVGGSAAEAIAIPGVLVTDLANVQLKVAGTNAVSVKLAATTANTLTVTFSADPGNNAVIYYQILRAAA